jgi:hypothetical protein
MTEVPDLPSGTILFLDPDDWRFGSHRLRLRVEAVRWDLAHYYDGAWVWVAGVSLGFDGMPHSRVEALVRVAAIARARLPFDDERRY